MYVKPMLYCLNLLSSLTWLEQVEWTRQSVPCKHQGTKLSGLVAQRFIHGCPKKCQLSQTGSPASEIHSSQATCRPTCVI
ncbi:hypothetical protein BDV25DRAFT_162733 [Aspergillus avenaceus]|uniref:Secreted protein n=1 Tax=Aspergillus avenaceus TaxID=36643 RepID=A0A5N6TIW8_ASPAV|nr:hypothetical protein BDV25DRAFT_162733 [Aspergillus avenaceus]